ncbi:hypothetical protein LTR08_005973 [Meristemomyces frigidus]|nr:hypothetical protein LTR08_005973 [Meristemomyces frigidus]
MGYDYHQRRHDQYLSAGGGGLYRTRSSGYAPQPVVNNIYVDQDRDRAQVQQNVNSIKDTMLEAAKDRQEMLAALDYLSTDLRIECEAQTADIEDWRSNTNIIFTTVTVIFLPLSVVASVFGMNTADVRNMESGHIAEQAGEVIVATASTAGWGQGVTATLSGISGTISIFCWVFLLVPQIYENYSNGNADGLSLGFLLIWGLGDITNLAGAVWGDLLGTVVALAVYFTVADCGIIGQVAYYKLKSRRGEARARDVGEGTGAAGQGGGANGKNDPRGAAGEETPLLAPASPSTTTPAHKKSRTHSFIDGNVSLPGSQLRRTSTQSSHSHHQHQRGASSSSLPAITETPAPPTQSSTSVWLKNTASVLAIILAGSLAWLLAFKSGIWTPTPPPGSHGAKTETMPLGAELLGYASAVCYLGARLPQIYKNHVERSCEGLSLLFFVLSVIGNATYGAGILLHSVERGYVIDNLPWLVGSLGTMAEDAVIFMQFSAFGDRTKGEDEDAEGDVAVE